MSTVLPALGIPNRQTAGGAGGSEGLAPLIPTGQSTSSRSNVRCSLPIASGACCLAQTSQIRIVFASTTWLRAQPAALSFLTVMDSRKKTGNHKMDLLRALVTTSDRGSKGTCHCFSRQRLVVIEPATMRQCREDSADLTWREISEDHHRHLLPKLFVAVAARSEPPQQDRRTLPARIDTTDDPRTRDAILGTHLEPVPQPGI